jgi:tubulin monoglycylase TTLL3/8
LSIIIIDILAVAGMLLNQFNTLSQYQPALSGSPGACSNNLWIVKPAALSRGRGIRTFADLSKLLKYVEAGTGLTNQCLWIVQKYMENPLIIAKRKFDLRQWVVVTDWNPLTIYFYKECYARFTVDEYDNNTDNLENSYAHLVNNSIGKNSENFTKTVVAENGQLIEGYMWSYDDFSQYMKYRAGNNEIDIMETIIQPRMQDIAKWSLQCGCEMVDHRKQSFELYGFDFMIDETCGAWLIEINASPACDYSTAVTERYVQKALVELLDVIQCTKTTSTTAATAATSTTSNNNNNNNSNNNTSNNNNNNSKTASSSTGNISRSS